MVKTLVAKDYRVKPGTWGESKQRVQIMLTPTAIELVDAIAEKMELTRAEVIERLIRSQCLNVETLKEIARDDD
ncbi:ribbon-helix-helix protein, CopG family [Nostoc sp. UHCC 0870]|uniref:ribbon-helix-helix protein, CopG family n=1 Tax=Nostoc sp. UHCC 0870 TaxID=2914041 RepID=UPI001EE00C33|nr:ribbon-helix-helix protein, CopG family [Nostoc sp. UHCC 0870]UKP00959.1 ribbon-helix-helix protein, CopG family [Nostoc sp. UHCC 0870]